MRIFRIYSIPDLYNFLCSPMSFNLSGRFFYTNFPTNNSLGGFRYIYCLAYLSIENSLISKIFSGSPGLRRSCKGNTGKFQILTFSLLSQLFQPSPCSQELEAWATQGHSDQDTGMCHSFGVKSVTILATLLPET